MFLSLASILRGPRRIDGVDFVVGGVQKAGTTALHHFISGHPHIAVLRDQSLHFFDDEKNFTGEPDYAVLHSNFRPKHHWQIAGEVTNDYTFWRPALERIARYNPGMKLIVSLRNPTARAFSHWNMRRAKGQEPRDFLDAIKRDQERNIDELSPETHRFAYIGRGLYFAQMERVFRYFPREQVLAIKYEDFRHDYTQTIDKVFDFLGVERLPGLKNRETNTAQYHRKITAGERAFVSAIFEQDTRRLESLLGWDCSDWRPRPASG